MGLLDDVVSVPRRTMTLFFLIDTSGSMQGNKIGAVNDAAFRVGVHAVDGVAVKGEGSAGFNDGFEDEPHQLFQLDFALQNPVVLHAVMVARFPFVAPIVFQ